MARGAGLHHISRRRRIHKRHEPYPHPKKWIRWLDRVVLAVAIIGPMANIPQIIKVYFENNISGLSLVTWVMFVLITIPWIFYGFIHKDKPIIVANILWFTTNVMIVIGIIIHSV